MPRLRIVVWLGLWLAATGCTMVQPARTAPSITPPIVANSETASASERVAFVRKMLSLEAPPILDAHYVEVQLGDGVMGPADYQFFARVMIAPENMEAWRQLLQAESETVSISTPAAPAGVTWWLPAQDVEQYDFYDAQPLLGRDGFVALHRAGEGVLYIFTFTR
jgi:hypothetical protein